MTYRGGRRFAPRDGQAVSVPPERRRRTFTRVVAFFRPYRRQVGIVLVAILGTSLLGLINPILLKLLIDEVINGRHFERLGLYIGLMIVIPIASGLIGVAQTYVSNIVGQHVMLDLRNALYTHLQRQPLRFFTETRTGEIQSRLANNVGGVQSVVTDTATNVTANLTVAISTVAAMVYIDWRLTLLSLGLTPFFLFLTARVGRVRRQVSSETQKSLADITAVTEETLSVSGVLLSKTFGQQAHDADRFRTINLRLARLQIRQAMVGRWFGMIIGTIFSITPAFVYWLAAALAMNGDPTAPTAGAIVAFTTLQSRLFFPLGQLLNVPVDIAGSLALFDRIFEYLDLEPGIADAPDAITLEPRAVRGAVRFRNVSFRYASQPLLSAGAASRRGGGSAAADAGGSTEPSAAPGKPSAAPGTSAAQPSAAPDEAAADAVVEPLTEEVLADRLESAAAAPGLERDDGPAEAAPLPFALEEIDFAAAPGQLVALVGPSGSGKTTTTYLIPRLYDVDTGAVEIDGVDVRRIALASLGRAIGMVTQETYLFHSSIGSNLRYARPEATDAELEAAARAAAIHDRIAELPEGYDTIVGERGYKLSGGEKQRIAIARVLLKDPRILVLDEATSALDTVSERLIQAALEGLMEGRTTIAIAHRLSTILRADQILVYNRGTIVERGTHAELLATGGLYARLYHEQFETPPEAVEAAEAAVGAP